MRIPVSAAPPALQVVYCEVDGLPVALEEKEFGPAGAFVVTTAPPAADSEIELYLRCNGSDATLKGHVVQVIDSARAAEEGRAPGFGVLFADLDGAQRDFITDAAERLRAHLAAQAGPGVRMFSSTVPATHSTPAPAREPIQLAPAHLDLPRQPVNRSARTRSSPEARSLVKRMREELEELAQLPPWGVLDLEADCSPQQAKTAFFMASKQFHPHLFARHNSAELDRLVTELFIVHKRAYTTLVRAARKEASDPVAEPVEDPSTPPTSRIRTRRTSERSGSSSQSPGASSDPPDGAVAARASLRPPAKPEPAGPEATRAQAEMRVGDALKHLAAGRFERALEELQRARDLDSTYEPAEVWFLLCEARKARSEDLHLVAIDRYNRVLKLDPQHHEALAAIRAAEASDGKKGRGLFGKLFGANKD